MRSLSALLAGFACVLSGSRTAGAEACARAHLVGDPGAVASVTDELRRLGVTTAPAARCRTIDATVAISGNGIAVAIAEQGRGSEGRVVADPRVAAAWIDSWLRDDFEAIEPAGAAATAPPPLEASSAPGTTIARDVAPAAAPAHTLRDRSTIAASYELAYLGDGSTWTGGSLAGCVHVGPVCLGARARGALQSSAEIGPDAVVVARNDFAAFATANLSVALGRTIVSPELGVGVGRFSTARAACPAPPPGCDPTTDPMMCTAPPPTKGCTGADGTTPDAGETVSTYSPRGEAALRIAIPLFDHVWLEATAAAAIAPIHRGTPAPMMLDPAGGSQPPLPGEPLTTFQLGVGLRIGAP